MPKIKRDSSDMDAGSSCQLLEPSSKRLNNNPSSGSGSGGKKVSSNFSIDSIMRSAADCGSGAQQLSPAAAYQQRVAHEAQLLAAASLFLGQQQQSNAPNHHLAAEISGHLQHHRQHQSRQQHQQPGRSGSGGSNQFMMGLPAAATGARSPVSLASSVSPTQSLSRRSSPALSVGSACPDDATTTTTLCRSPALNSAANNSASANLGDGNCGSGRLSQVKCTLDNKDMWDRFHALNTEMIITKTGRRMFPVMKVQFSNLDPNARYAVSMDIMPVDNKRYRYAYHKSCWQQAGKADPSAEPRLYPHPDSPFNGDLLSRQVISFEKVKLTNNEMDKSGHIILNSMHKYQPRVHLIELKAPATATGTTINHHNNHHLNHQLNHQTSSSRSHHNHHHQSSTSNHHSHQQPQAPQLDIEGYKTFTFPETVFTAVTAYQNQLITKLKIDKNPFAKGFRDSSRLSDLDRNDPFDYMTSMGPSAGRFPGQMPGGGPMDAAGAAQMDATYQLFAQNPWYSAAAVAAATGNANPFANPMGAAAACSTAQAAQAQLQTMWLAAFSACLNNGANGAATPNGGGAQMSPAPPTGSLSSAGNQLVPASGPSPHTPLGGGGSDQLNADLNGPDSNCGRSSANSSGTSN